MERRITITALLISLLSLSAGCATLQTAEHKFIMKGQMLEVSDGSAYLCTGIPEGAKPGEVYTVYRETRVPGGRIYYYRTEIGKVKVEKLVDDHYAKAKILSGPVKEHDIVGLDQ